MIEEDPPKVLCVDDEPQVLQGLERSLFEHFDVVTANSGKEALELMEEEGPFPVIVSDMRMPEMDGAAFLSEARRRAPDTVRVLLTGHADMDSAIKAVNHGNIYRFLSKPCEQSVLLQTLKDGVELYRLLTLEKELLSNTLNGAVKMMVKVMQIAAPTAFQKASAIHGYVRHVCQSLKLENAWVFESAALLSRAGYVVLPDDVADKVDAAKALDESEQEMLTGAYETAARLVSEVPRLNEVGEIIRALGLPKAAQAAGLPDVVFGTQLLRVADQLDTLQRQGFSTAQALPKVEGLEPKVRIALLKYRGRQVGTKTQLVRLAELRGRMVLDQDVLTENEVVIARKGQELNGPMIDRLKNFDKSRKIVQPIRVVLPGEAG